MHGVIFDEFRNYIESQYGGDGWKRVLQESGVGWPKLYMPVREYPDEEAIAIITTASRLMGAQTTTILEDFGEYIAPALIEMCGRLIKPGWKTLEVLEHTGEIYRAINNVDAKARQSALHCARTSQEGVMISYSSPRRMCSVAKGIVKGMARRYNEQVLIAEKECMLKGNIRCMISVLVVGDSPKLGVKQANLSAASKGD